VGVSTNIGMFGGLSHGYHHNIARQFSRAYDEMFFYVLLGAAVIFIGDTISFFLRRSLMRS
jgi:ABC-type phosphate/phosphonate transport system permease subunit